MDAATIGLKYEGINWWRDDIMANRLKAIQSVRTIGAIPIVDSLPEDEHNSCGEQNSISVMMENE